ncbi:unnamed protein product [Strongylus vulgaris]|uniref:Uncharacterized protein n=1 Tax=Strongylus vulgaris TaxID=40348 RepID=A0A3P7K941_STRVU|nr:unnamed protein product [Strongylus vulgaris]
MYSHRRSSFIPHPQERERERGKRKRCYVICILEKANDVIRRQSAELDRLRSSDLHVENIALRTQLMEIAQDYRLHQERILDQEVLLSELNHEVKSLARDKDILQERCIELERKYKKAKAASKEFEKLIDLAEPCSSSTRESTSLLDRSRKKHMSPLKSVENGLRTGRTVERLEHKITSGGT